MSKMNVWVFIISIFLILSCTNAFGQDYLNIQDRQNLRSHALDNIKEYEHLLNEIISSNNPEEKKIIILNSEETVIEETASIEDDLNPDKSTITSDFIKYDTYLERFPFFLLPDNVQNPVTFSNIQVSDIHKGEYVYLTVYFECLFSGVHKVTGKKYKNVQRLATVRIFNYNGREITKIVNIKFSNNYEQLKVKREAAAFDKEFKGFQESLSYRNKLAQQEYDFNIQEAEKHFASKDYAVAKEKYLTALIAKPNDHYATNQISICENILQQLEADRVFERLIKEGEHEFAHKNYFNAKSKYESAQSLRSNDSHVKFMISKINRKLNPKFPNKTTAYLGVNYNFSETPISWATNSKSFEDGLKSDFSIESMGVSFYYPIGLYISGIKTFEDIEPDYHYSIETVNSIKTNFQNSNADFTDLTFIRKGEHTGAFNFGIYLSFFRPLYFKLGMKQRFGSQWDLYSGDYKGQMNYTSNSTLYAINYESSNHTDFQAGFAIVVPYAQLEATYDNFSQSIQVSAGINYPFRNVYFLKTNPNKVNKRTEVKKYPYQKTFYVAISYDFFNYYPDFTDEFQYENLTANTFSSPISEKFSLSMYYKLGFFISGLRQTNDKKPNYYYSTSDVNQKRTSLLSSNTPFTELTYIKSESNFTKFNAGISLCFFRPLHFKFGASFANGGVWNVYSGDFHDYMNKFNDSQYYAIDYDVTIDSKFIGGIAIVLPFFQLEVMYDGFYNKYSLAAGLNVPIVRK